MLRWWKISIFAGLGILLAGIAVAQPINDSRSQAVPMASALPVGTTGDNTGATTEAGEILPGSLGGKSVWYRWTAPSSGWVRVHTLPVDPLNDLDTVLAIYKGPEFMMGFNDEGYPAEGPSRLVFFAEENATYEIGVYGYDYGSIIGEGPFELHIESVPDPPAEVTWVGQDPKPVDVSSGEEAVVIEFGLVSSVALFDQPDSFGSVSAYWPDAMFFETTEFNSQKRYWGDAPDGSGNYAVAFSISALSQSGQWPVVISIPLPDGESITWSPQGPDPVEDHHLIRQVSQGFLDVVNSSNVDLSPPSIASFEVTPSANLDIYQEATIEIRVLDAGGSGFQSGFLWIVDDDDDATFLADFDHSDLVEGTANDGVYRIVFDVPYKLAAGNYYWEIILQDTTGNNSISTSQDGANQSPALASQSLVIGTPPIIEAWRKRWFGSPLDSGIGGNLADPDGDTIPNAIEMATGGNPLLPDQSPAGFAPGSSPFAFVYRRSVMALFFGYGFSVEWNDRLEGPWTPLANQGEVVSLDGDIQHVEVPVDLPAGGSRFFRLRVIPPPGE
jgi:hypothetical protein